MDMTYTGFQNIHCLSEMTKAVLTGGASIGIPIT